VTPNRRVEVTFSDKKLDSGGISTKNDIIEDLHIKEIDSVRTSEIYYFYSKIDEKKLAEISEKVLTDPLTQTYSLKGNAIKDFSCSVEIKLHEDVTDNVGIVAQEAVEDFLGKKLEGKIRVSRKYYFFGKITKQTAEKIAKELLANSVIETFEVEVK